MQTANVLMFTKNKTQQYFMIIITLNFHQKKKKSELNTMGLYFTDEEIGDTMQWSQYT